MDEQVSEKSREPGNGEATSKEEDKRQDNRGVDENKDHCKEAVIEEGDDHELSSDDSYVTCVEVLSDDESKTAKDNEITGEESPGSTASYELGESSKGDCGTSSEKGGEDGTQPKEMPVKGILAVKLKTEKKNVQSDFLEVRPETIGVVTRKKSVTLIVREEDSKKKELDDVPPKSCMEVEFKNKKEEPKTASPGKELLEKIEGGLHEGIKFTPKRGDQHRSHFRHQQTVGQIAENREWHLDTDDVRYGVHRTYSDQPPQEEPGCWTICKVLGMDLCCCCLCKPPPDPYLIEEVEDDEQAALQEERRENEEVRLDDKAMDDISLNANTEIETKPKRFGRMKRIKRFFKRLFCCTAGCRED